MRNPLNSHKNFNPTAITSITAMRACAFLMPQVSPNAYSLSRYLATWWNGSTANGVVNPNEKRIMEALTLTRDELHTAALELNSIEWWKPIFNEADFITSYKPLFLSRLTNEQFDGLTEMRTSLNHSKADSRYFRLENTTAKAISAYAIDRISSRFSDLGYSHFMRTNQREEMHLIDNHGGKKKMVHSVMFNYHLFAGSGSPFIWAALARTERIPVDWVTRPHLLSFTLGKLCERIDIPADDVAGALEYLKETGYWAISVAMNPFAESEFDDETMITMTPLLPFHQLAWELDRNEGGQKLSAWEQSRSFGMGLDRDRPPLGYHFIYGLRSVLSGKFLIVGQTTQPLDNRLSQHMRTATNIDANAAIKWVVDSESDSLEIVHLGTVHISVAAQVEVDWMHKMIALGHPLQNKILTVERNRSTIKPDSRFEGLQTYDKWEELAFEVAACLNANRGRTVMYENQTVYAVPAKMETGF